VLLAQTLYFIDLCTGKHESNIFPLTYTYWTMYIFLLSKEVHSLKNIIRFRSNMYNIKKIRINGTQARQIFMLLHVHISKYSKQIQESRKFFVKV